MHICDNLLSIYTNFIDDQIMLNSFKMLPKTKKFKFLPNFWPYFLSFLQYHSDFGHYMIWSWCWNQYLHPWERFDEFMQFYGSYWLSNICNFTICCSFCIIFGLFLCYNVCVEADFACTWWNVVVVQEGVQLPQYANFLGGFWGV